MTPVEQAADFYLRTGQPRTFREDLEAHLLNGYVFSTPDCFLMARPVSSRADITVLADPFHTFDHDEHDTWLVWLAAGSMVSVKKYLTDPPYALPQVAWARHNRLRFYDTKTLTTTICRLFSVSSSKLSSAHGLALHPLVALNSST